jgi:hypothetical protein
VWRSWLARYLGEIEVAGSSPVTPTKLKQTLSAIIIPSNKFKGASMKCESCGMPLDGQFKSKFSEKYCIYCQNQETGELSSYEQVKEGSIWAAKEKLGKSPEEAEKMVNELLPTLPRWSNQS